MAKNTKSKKAAKPAKKAVKPAKKSAKPVAKASKKDAKAAKQPALPTVNNRGKYDEKEKREAVAKAFTGQRGAIVAVARELNVSTNTLHDWKKQLNA